LILTTVMTTSLAKTLHLLLALTTHVNDDIPHLCWAAARNMRTVLANKAKQSQHGRTFQKNKNGVIFWPLTFPNTTLPDKLIPAFVHTPQVLALANAPSQSLPHPLSFFCSCPFHSIPSLIPSINYLSSASLSQNIVLLSHPLLLFSIHAHKNSDNRSLSFTPPT